MILFITGPRKIRPRLLEVGWIMLIVHGVFIMKSLLGKKHFLPWIYRYKKNNCAKCPTKSAQKWKKNPIFIFQNIHLISGFQTQGPPQALHPKEYLRYVGLDVEISIDGKSWEPCCNGAKMAVSICLIHLFRELGCHIIHFIALIASIAGPNYASFHPCSLWKYVTYI